MNKVLLNLAGLFVAGLGLCHGGTFVVGQWDGVSPVANTEFIEGTNVVEGIAWHSLQGMELYARTKDWEVVAENQTLPRRVVNRAGASAGGWWFDYENAAGEVWTGVMVVEPTAPLRVREALFTGEHVARLANRPGGGEEGLPDRGGAAAGVAWRVDGEANAPLRAGERQVVEFDFPASVPLYNAMIGGDPGLPAWRRAFDGEIYAVVLFGGEVPSEGILRGVRHGMALRYGIPGMRNSSSAERAAAQAAGVNFHGVFGTVFMVR